MYSSVFLIFFLLKTHGISSFSLSDVGTVIANNFELKDQVVVFHSPCPHSSNVSDLDFPSYIVKNLAECGGTFTFQVYSLSIRPKSAVKQRKNVDADTIILIASIFGNKTELLQFFEALRTMRIIGRNTKFFIFSYEILSLSEMAELFHLFWKMLKVWKILLLQFYLNKFHVYGRTGNDLTAGIKEISIYDFKFQDFNITGYNLQAGALTVPPLVMEPTAPLKFDEGVHVNLVLTACQHLKINITFKDVDPDFGRVTVLNGTYQGIFRLLHRQEIDVAIADLRLLPPRVAAAIPLPSAYQFESVWCAPKKFNVAAFKILTGALSYRTWFSLIISFICIIIVFYFQNRNSYSMEYIFFTIFAISLQGCMRSPDKLFLPYRLLFGLVLIFFLMISTCYSSGLVTLVKVPPLPKQIQTIQEAYDEGPPHNGKATMYDVCIMFDALLLPSFLSIFYL